MNQPKPLRVLVKIKNNRLIELREARGMSAKETAEACGVSYSTYVDYEGLRLKAKHWYPRRSDSAVWVWRASAMRIADFWGQLPDDLFPEVTQSVAKTSSYFKANEKEVKRFVSGTRENLPCLPEEIPDRVVFVKEIMPAVMDALVYFIENEAYDTRSNRARDVDMFMDRYGICGRDEHTYEEISVKYTISRERVRQIECRLLRVLRDRMLKRLSPHRDRSDWKVLNEYAL